MARSSNQPAPAIIRFDHVTKRYGTGNAATTALRNVSFSIEPGAMTAIIGPSGSGKSTVLNLLGLLDRPTSGEITVHGQRAHELTRDEDRARLRRETIGFIFQQFNLLPKASALENVAMPGVYSGRRDRGERAKRLLTEVGLGHRLDHRPGQLSGGEQQRVAIARSLMNDPSLLLADEPTGNLDSTTGREILKLLHALNDEGKTVVIVTHDPVIAAGADHIIQLRDGTVVEPRRNGRRS